MISIHPVSASLQRRRCSSLVSFLCFVADRTLGSKIFLPSLRRISHLRLRPGGLWCPRWSGCTACPSPWMLAVATCGVFVGVTRTVALGVHT